MSANPAFSVTDLSPTTRSATRDAAGAARITPWSARILLSPAALPVEYAPWVNLPGSMTLEIEQRLGTRPEVLPTREAPDRPAPWEAALLETRTRTVYAREVVLSVGLVSVLHARTLTLNGDPAVTTLRKLKRTPLAQVLFLDDRWQRSGRPVPLLMRSTAGAFYGRASLWKHTNARGSRLLVEEYFLPPLTRSPPQVPQRD